MADRTDHVVGCNQTNERLRRGHESRRSLLVPISSRLQIVRKHALVVIQNDGGKRSGADEAGRGQSDRATSTTPPAAETLRESLRPSRADVGRASGAFS